MHIRNKIMQVSFILPAVILLGLFLIIPFIMAFGLSLTNQRLVPGLNPVRFVGFDNYIRMWTDSQFWHGLQNNLIFVLFVVPVQAALALFIAMLVNSKLKFTKFFRTVYFMPTVTTMVVVSITWTFIYFPEGILNSVLIFITGGHWKPTDFLFNPAWAFPSIMFMSIWQGVGFQMLIFLAGLQEISPSLYEAAAIDGANSRQKFRHITLPQLKNTVTFVLVATTILAFRLFDQVLIMTGGGPGDATYTMMLHIYNSAFQRQNIGYGSALTVVFFLIVLVFSILQRLFLTEEKEG